MNQIARRLIGFAPVLIVAIALSGCGSPKGPLTYRNQSYTQAPQICDIVKNNMQHINTGEFKWSGNGKQLIAEVPIDLVRLYLKDISLIGSKCNATAVHAEPDHVFGNVYTSGVEVGKVIAADMLQVLGTSSVEALEVTSYSSQSGEQDVELIYTFANFTSSLKPFSLNYTITAGVSVDPFGSQL